MLVAEDKPGSGMRSRATYSMWFNGNVRTTGYFHNQIGLLTEIKGHPTPWSWRSGRIDSSRALTCRFPTSRESGTSGRPSNTKSLSIARCSTTPPGTGRRSCTTAT